MNGVAAYVWLIPLCPLIAAAVTALLPRQQRRLASGLAIGAISLSFLLSVLSFLPCLTRTADERVPRFLVNFDWVQLGSGFLRLGWMVDPMSAAMLVMVSFVGGLIFIYSVGYMANDENFTRFFCYLSLFAAAMLGLVVANSLLLLFICWEIVGLASYLLIGFWFHKPAAAAAARKAFVTTRIGDIGLLLGMVWLYSETGSLVFYDEGRGCLEQTALSALASKTLAGGMAVTTSISILIFCGAAGKSGQIPLHVWLPDAMEGPTPVSALIHAATMVAAGVFLVARMHPLMSLGSGLQVVAWVGALTAVFAASIAVAQTDIKRILAYSTISQLGYMMLGLGTGGVAVGMFHLFTHAFFKALLFLGAGSVIHGCHGEQDIRRMGGLRKLMPVTFATYGVGMMALAGFPLFFSGFWSKDAILHAAHTWPISKGPFLLGLLGTLLTAFYMTRQMLYVFFGTNRSTTRALAVSHGIHESAPTMTMPLVVLALFSVTLGFLGTPVWPWFDAFIAGRSAHWALHHLTEALPTMGLSTIIVLIGTSAGWWCYGRGQIAQSPFRDTLAGFAPRLYSLLRDRWRVDEFYAATFQALNQALAELCDLLDRRIWGGMVRLITAAAEGFCALSRWADDQVINGGFEHACRRLSRSGGILSACQDGQIRNYLRVVAVAVVLLMLWLLMGESL